MAVLKCKMCGGNIEVGENKNIGVCDSCGSTMTIPNVNDERILNLFDRANHFRLQNEFDKALAAYESILSEDNKNAEAHWGCVLSRYGIEYVKDPKTHKRVPTCHRVQNESVLSDLDYKAAVEYTDDISAKNLYQQEAEAIAEIQKNILSIANNEAPYDIFICYKETDNSGRRTVDSALAQDIYYQLTNEGYKVFFSRITLEDKLGAEYEPYIFSALNSARVMLVVGTNKDYFNAVWVKNEWARFLDLARKDKSKTIIPCYRDIDAYDLPDELSMYQSQDMGKIGFVQDLIRGIKKVLQKETPRSSITAVKSTAEAFRTEPLLKRAFMMLEDEEWEKANELLEQVLNHEPENAFAYLGKLMIEYKLRRETELSELPKDFGNSKNYQYIIRFGDETLKCKINKYREIVVERIKQKEKERAEAELRDEEARKRAYEEMRIRHKKAQSLIKPLLNMIEREEAKRKEFVDNIVSAILVTLFLYVILCVILNYVVYYNVGYMGNDYLTIGVNVVLACIFIVALVIVIIKFNSKEVCTPAEIDKMKLKVLLYREKAGECEIEEEIKKCIKVVIEDKTPYSTLYEGNIKSICNERGLSPTYRQLSIILDMAKSGKVKYGSSKQTDIYFQKPLY